MQATTTMTLLVGSVAIWACSAFAQMSPPSAAPDTQPATAEDYYHRGEKRDKGDFDGASQTTR